MATSNPRINVTLDDETVGILGDIARIKNKPVASVARDLLLEALELHEDIYLSIAADKAIKESKDKPTLSHEYVWKKSLQNRIS